MQTLSQVLLKNQALLAVIIGGALTLLATFLTAVSGALTERRRWNREDRLARKKMVEENRRADAQAWQEALTNSASALAALASYRPRTSGGHIVGDPTEATDEQRGLIKEASRWLILLPKYQKLDREFASQFRENYTRFLINPLEYAHGLHHFLTTVLAPESAAAQTRTSFRSGKRSFSISVDYEYRKLAIAAGKEVPPSYGFELTIEELTASQREKLADQLLSGFGVRLPPAGNPKGTWLAKLDPVGSNPVELLAAWEKDYDAAGAVSATPSPDNSSKEPEGTVNAGGAVAPPCRAPAQDK
ncbi:MAG TPA: hypothetical protein VFJ58_19630 [Armatimonadota bacterium]|nr:hypothetical protein [Armatimonadota bacterium]